MPSVTEILAKFPESELMEWRIRVGEKKAQAIMQQSQILGLVVDECIQRIVRGQADTSTIIGSSPNAQQIGERANRCLAAWDLFTVSHPDFMPSIQHMQRELAAGELRGHPDFERRLDGAWGIDDLKCTGAIRHQHWAQVGGYAWLRMQQTSGERPGWLGILRLDPDTGLHEYMDLTDPQAIDYQIQTFLHYKALYEHRLEMAAQYRAYKEEEVLGCTIG